jgi:hypothetical protein
MLFSKFITTRTSNVLESLKKGIYDNNEKELEKKQMKKNIDCCKNGE